MGGGRPTKHQSNNSDIESIKYDTNNYPHKLIKAIYYTNISTTSSADTDERQGTPLMTEGPRLRLATPLPQQYRTERRRTKKRQWVLPCHVRV